MTRPSTLGAGYEERSCGTVVWSLSARAGGGVPLVVGASAAGGGTTAGANERRLRLEHQRLAAAPAVGGAAAVRGAAGAALAADALVGVGDEALDLAQLGVGLLEPVGGLCGRARPGRSGRGSPSGSPPEGSQCRVATFSASSSASRRCSSSSSPGGCSSQPDPILPCRCRRRSRVPLLSFGRRRAAGAQRLGQLLGLLGVVAAGGSCRGP